MNPTKNKNLKRALLAVTAVGLVAASGVALAGPGGYGAFGFGPQVMRLMQRLDLTEEQEVQAVRARRALRQEAKGLRRTVQAMRTELAAELVKAEPDAAKLHGLADQILQQMNKTSHAAIDQFLELHRTLTPEQREKLAEHIERIDERRERRRQRRRGGR